MTALEIAREELPELSDDARQRVIENETGWPCFWRIGIDGATPEECFRTELRRHRDGKGNGQTSTDVTGRSPL